MKRIIFILFLGAATQTLTAQWKELPPKPDSANDRVGAMTFSIGNRIFYGGGAYEGTLSYDHPRTDFYEFNIDSNKWFMKNDIPGYIEFGPSFAMNGKGYAILTNFPQSNMWEYEPSSDSWTEKSAPIPNGLLAGAFVINNRAYVAANSSTGKTVIFEYDPLANNWTKKDSINLSDQSLSSFVIDSLAYIVFWPSGALWQYDPSVDSWMQKHIFTNTSNGISFSLPERHKQINLITQRDSEYVLEYGYAGLGLNFGPYIDRYDPAADIWEGAAELAFPGKMVVTTGRGPARQAAVSIKIGDTIYIGDGADGQGLNLGNYFNDWWSFTPFPSIIVDTIKPPDTNHHNDSTFQGISKFQKEPVSCFPQPAITDLFIAGLSTSDNFSISISDVIGRKIFSSVDGTNPKINISRLLSGIYYLSIKQGKENYVLRFIKY